jgi:Tfp pilus assembly protein PilO
MSLRPRDRIAIAVVLLVVVVAGYYMLALKPEQNKASALNAAIAVQRKTLAQEQQAYAVGRAAAAALKADAPEWAALRLAVPPQSDIPGLLRTLQRNAAAVHVNMQAIALSGPSGASPAAGATAPSTGVATPVPVSLTFSGGYTALNNLVRRLDGLVVLSGGKVRATGPLLSISSVSLAGSSSLTVQLTATIYQLTAPSTAPTGG